MGGFHQHQIYNDTLVMIEQNWLFIKGYVLLGCIWQLFKNDLLKMFKLYWCSFQLTHSNVLVSHNRDTLKDRTGKGGGGMLCFIAVKAIDGLDLSADVQSVVFLT